MMATAGAPLNLAFLGCGFATQLHSRTLSAFSTSEVRRYYASREPARAAEFNRRYRGSGEFGSYEAAFVDPAIDVVLVATPPASHLELTLRALDAGKHVIVEKPAFLGVADFAAVRAAQQRSGRRVLVAENYYYKPLAERLREIVRSGTIGEPLILSVNALKQQRKQDWRDDVSQAGGGALFEGGIHWINFMANLGLSVERSRGFQPGPVRDPERTMVVVFEYTSGAVGTLYHSWEAPSPLRGLRLSRIYGSEGAVAFESNGLALFVYGRKTRFTIPRPRDLLGYRGMFEDFLHALRAGTEPRMTLDLAQRDLELLEETYRSANLPLQLRSTAA